MKKTEKDCLYRGEKAYREIYICNNVLKHDYWLRLLCTMSIKSPEAQVSYLIITGD